MIFENETIYKVLKKVWQYAIPAIAYLWSVLYKTWNIPYGLQIFTTICGVWTAMAIFLGISKWKYMNACEGYLGDGKGDYEEVAETAEIEETEEVGDE